MIQAILSHCRSFDYSTWQIILFKATGSRPTLTPRNPHKWANGNASTDYEIWLSFSLNDPTPLMLTIGEVIEAPSSVTF